MVLPRIAILNLGLYPPPLPGKDRKVSKRAEKVPLVEEAAGDILQTFETISHDALTRLNSAPVRGTDVLASVNALTLVRGLNAIDGLIQAERDSLLILSREPAIARVKIKDQNGVESTIFICRTTPSSNSSTYASNRSALGRLAALPVGNELSVGPRILTVLEKEKLRPTLKADLWDSENTEFEALDFGVFTVEYLRPFLKSGAPVQETANFLSQLLADEQFKANIVEGKRRLVIEKMSLRDQPILDQYQDEIFRLPLRKRLFILGPAGTGKTTTLIRRLGQKRDTAYLEPEERDLVEAISASGTSSHRDSWLMFTPTELLKQYLKEAFAKEGVPAPAQRITTWFDFSRDLARNRFNVLRSANSRSGFVLKPSVSYLTAEVQVSSFQLFQEFFTWQVRRYVTNLYDAMLVLNKSANQEVAALAQRLRGFVPNGLDDLSIVTVMTSLYSLSGQVTGIIGRLKGETDAILDNSLIRELSRNRDFLTQLGQFIASIQTADVDDSEEEDETEVEEEDALSQHTGILAARTAYRRAMRAHARETAGSRSVRSTSANGQIVKWLGDRVLSVEDASKAGESLLIQDAVRQFANPVRRYIRGIPSRYRRFRRSQNEQTKWYSGTAPASEIGFLELDVVLLAILQAGSELLSLASVSSSVSDPFWSPLQPINDLYKHQILIDEAADFASVQLGCIAALANPRLKSVFACGDFNQRMTSWGIRSLDEVKMVFPDVDVRRITTTYRQSRRLNELARAIVEAFGGSGDVATVPADMDFEGESPVLIEGCSVQASLVAWIAERIREIERFVGKLPSIAIFVGNDQDVQPLAEALNRALEDTNIQAEACLGGKAVGQETDVRVFAVEFIKGLEFESVFFIGVDRLMQSYPDLYDKYLYVGATRAATYLGFTCEGSLPNSLAALGPMFVPAWSQQSSS
jgi:hypothetical protein